ncbi:MAG: hypothetical protein NC341_02070 [Blautia sp.]|nr:hypothetical protein [Blautia sp.]MCM1200404.1 hypothetical protein [Bacteroides fragilis]
MRNWTKILIMMTAVWMLAGCGSEEAPDRNTVSIQKDGTIRQVIVDQFEQEYYNIEELEALAQEKIDRSGSGGTIACESVKADGENIIVEMTYQADNDYTDFNNRELFCGTVSEASAQGYALQGLVSQDGTAVSGEDIPGENRIVIIQTKAGEVLDVNVYGKIVYTSGNITLSGKKDALIDAGENDVVSYVIYQ